MSYPVRVVVKETVKDVVRTRDELTLCLAQDPVLQKPGAQERLRGLLAAGGWEADGSRFRKTLPNGVEVVWDLEAQQLVLRGEAEEQIETSTTQELRGDSLTRDGAARQEEELKVAGRELLRQQLAKRLEGQREDAERDMLADIQARVEAAHAEVEREIHSMLETVYRDWLVEQAHTLGQVVSQHESVSADGEVFELTIRIAN